MDNNQQIETAAEQIGRETGVTMSLSYFQYSGFLIQTEDRFTFVDDEYENATPLPEFINDYESAIAYCQELEKAVVQGIAIGREQFKDEAHELLGAM